MSDRLTDQVSCILNDLQKFLRNLHKNQQSISYLAFQKITFSPFVTDGRTDVQSEDWLRHQNSLNIN